MSLESDGTTPYFGAAESFKDPSTATLKAIDNSISMSNKEQYLELIL